MNILLCHPEFPLSFFNFPKTGRMPFKACAPPLGLLTVAALIPAGHNLRLADENVAPAGPSDFAWADMVWISAMLPQKTAALDLVRRAKAYGKTVLLGGPYATFYDAALLEAGCDFVVQGEAEEVAASLFTALAAGSQGGVFKAGPADMSRSPLPRYDLIDPGDYGSCLLQTTRGCPNECEFCQVVELNGRLPRHKSLDQVMAELQQLYELGWRDTLLICDDNFIGDKAYARELLERLVVWSKSRGEPFVYTIQASLELARHQELIDLLTEANVTDVFIGVESPDAELLQKMRKRKNVQNPLVESLRLINRNGLSIHASFILGFDSESAGAGARIVEFAEKANISTVMLNRLFALPGTALWKRLESERRLRPEEAALAVSGWATNFLPTRPDEEIASEFCQALQELYAPRNYIERSCRMILERRPTRAALAENGGPAYAEVVPAKRRLSLRLRRLYFAGRFFFRHGLCQPHRGLFWRRLYTVYRQNPSRLVDYLVLLITCDFYAAFTRQVMQGGKERAASPSGLSG